MANVQHYTRASVREILAHNSRKENYSNRDIDPSRTHYNFSLSGHADDYAYYEKRLSEVHCMKRANVNTLSSWVITVPHGLPKNLQKAFFMATVNFLNDRYGKENCVSADVHYDETTPHLHYTFIPVVLDQKKMREKVSRKELFTLKELYSFHDDLSNYLSDKLCHDISMRTGTTERNLSIRELKQQTKEKCESIVNDAEKEASDKKENAEKEASKIIADAQKIRNALETEGHKEYQRLIDKANAEKAKIEEWFADQARLMKVCELTKIELDKIREAKTKLKKKIFGKDTVELERDLAEKLFDYALCKETASKMHDSAVEIYNLAIEKLKNLKLDEKSKEEREREIAGLQYSNSVYKTQNKKLEDENKQYRMQLQEHGIAIGRGRGR